MEDKKNLQDTAQSFCPLQKSEIKGQNCHFSTQINQLVSLLTQKKSQLRQAKLEQAKYREKYEQQNARLLETQIFMQAQIEKEELQLNSKTKSQQTKQLLEKSINEYIDAINFIRSELRQIYQALLLKNSEYGQLQKNHRNKQQQIANQNQNNHQVEKQIVSLQEIININRRQILQNSDHNTKQQLQITQLESLLSSYKSKINIGQKQINQQRFEGEQTKNQITATQDKIAGTKACIFDTNNQTDKIVNTNEQIQEVNSKLKLDLQKVKNHLENIKKTNKMIHAELGKYCITSHKVSKLVLLDP